MSPNLASMPLAKKIEEFWRDHQLDHKAHFQSTIRKYVLYCTTGKKHFFHQPLKGVLPGNWSRFVDQCKCGYPTLTSFKKPGNSASLRDLQPTSVLQRSRLLNYLEVDVWHVYPIELYTSIHIYMKCFWLPSQEVNRMFFAVSFLFTVLIVSL